MFTVVSHRTEKAERPGLRLIGSRGGGGPARFRVTGGPETSRAASGGRETVVLCSLAGYEFWDRAVDPGGRLWGSRWRVRRRSGLYGAPSLGAFAPENRCALSGKII